MRDAFWLQGMQVGLKGAYDCIKAFSETDFTEDLKKIDVPTLIIHGDDDQIVPIGDVGADARRRSSRTRRSRSIRARRTASTSTHKDQFNADLLAFVKQVAGARAAERVTVMA